MIELLSDWPFLGRQNATGFYDQIELKFSNFFGDIYFCDLITIKYNDNPIRSKLEQNKF